MNDEKLAQIRESAEACSESTPEILIVFDLLDEINRLKGRLAAADRSVDMALDGIREARRQLERLLTAAKKP